MIKDTAGTDGLRSRAGRLISNPASPILLVLIVMVVFAAIATPAFLDPFNLGSLARDFAFAGIIAVAMTILLIVAELDLSVGAMASLSGIVAGMLMVNLHVNGFLAMALGVLLGAILGFLNGALTVWLRLNSLVVTIGTTGVFTGVTLVATKGKAITDIPENVLFMGGGDFLGVPVPLYILAVVFVGSMSILKLTRAGRHVYAIGNSIEASRLIGVHVARIKISLFVVVGALSGLAGILYVARLGSAQTSIGDSWAINAIAAAVIGGVALFGGVGSPFGAVVGAGVIVVISDLIVLFGVSVYWQTAVSGIVVVVAISFGALSEMARGRREVRRSMKRLTQSVRGTNA